MATSRRRSSDIDKRVGARLRFIRLERGLTQEQLGDALGVTFQQVQKYENGTNALASTRIPILCTALQIAPNDLFNGYAYQAKNLVGDTIAIDIGIRVAKLGPKARKMVGFFVDLIETNNDARTNR